MPEKTHWRKIIESEYLAGADLDDGQGNHKDIILTIRDAKREKVRDIATGKDDICLVLHFVERSKPMICNVTNAKAISKVAKTDYIEDWAGVRIQIGTEKVKAFGEIWDALRVRPYIKEHTQQQTTPVCSDCKAEIPAHEGIPGSKIAATTLQKYGRPLCFDCAQIVRQAAEGGADVVA